MMRHKSHGLALLATLGVLMTVSAHAKEPATKTAAPRACLRRKPANGVYYRVVPAP